MSFILDALKKSENERQRQVGPSLADVQVTQRANNKPWWAVAVAALLVVNLGVLILVLLRDGDAKSNTAQRESEGSTENTLATDARAGTQMPLPASASRMPRGNPTLNAPTSPGARSLADEAGSDEAGVVLDTDPQLSGAANVPEGPPLVRPIDAPAVAPATFPAQSQAQNEPDEVLPTQMDLAAGGTVLPEMHLDIHVYSARPADRFVFVNMQKYTEGQALKEGPTLERITQDGAILNHRGMRFLLPRQ
jgi:general secretion pathway protein B